MTVAHQTDSHLSRRLQKDSITISGKVIYINPFLYWRRFDNNTDRWLREPGQLGEEQINLNRARFYPELDWTFLKDEERVIKDAAVEMFLKTLELNAEKATFWRINHFLQPIPQANGQPALERQAVAIEQNLASYFALDTINRPPGHKSEQISRILLNYLPS